MSFLSTFSNWHIRSTQLVLRIFWSLGNLSGSLADRLLRMTSLNDRFCLLCLASSLQFFSTATASTLHWIRHVPLVYLILDYPSGEHSFSQKQLVMTWQHLLLLNLVVGITMTEFLRILVVIKDHCCCHITVLTIANMTISILPT